MKAILVIDMPDTCYHCPLESQMRCVPRDKLIEFGEEEMKKVCPLKPMPIKRVPDGSETDQIYGCYVGWNTCLKEIGDDGEW